MSSAYNTLAFRIALGDDLVQSPGPFLTSSHPSVTGSAPATGSFVYENGPITEIYSDAFIINSSSVGYGHSVYSALVNPPNIGAFTEVTSKIRIPSQSLVTGSTLSPHVSIQEPYDPAYTKDLSYLEVAISPQNSINDDIKNDLGYFNIDEFIGHPAYAASGSYPDLDHLRKDYFKKYIRKQNIFDTIKLLSYYDNSLFKMIKDFVPAKVRLAAGLVIKPNILERSKHPHFAPKLNRPEFSGSMLTLPYLPNENQKLVAVTGSNALEKNINTSYTQSITTISGSITHVQVDRRETLTGEYGGSTITAYKLPTGSIAYEDNNTLLRNVKYFGDLISSGDAQDKIIPYGNYQTRSFYDGVDQRVAVVEKTNPGDSQYVVQLSNEGFASNDPGNLPLQIYELAPRVGGTNNEGTYTISAWVAFSSDFDGDTDRVFSGYAASTQTGGNVELSGRTGSLLETAVVGGQTWYHYAETWRNPPASSFTQSVIVGENDETIPGFVQLLLCHPLTNTTGKVWLTNIQVNPYTSVSERIYEKAPQIAVNPYFQNITSSRPNPKYLDADYSTNVITPVNYNFITGRLEGSISKEDSKFLDSTTPESNYTLVRSINPRYNGSKISSLLYNEFTPGDNSYGGNSTTDKAVQKFAYFEKTTTAGSGSFFDRTNVYLKYLIDGDRNVTELNQGNDNLFEVQNLFNNQQNLVLSLQDNSIPYDNLNLDGEQRIYAGGFRFEPMLAMYPSSAYSALPVQIPQHFDEPIQVPVPNLGTGEGQNASVNLGGYNFDQVGASPSGRTIFLSGQVRVAINRTQLGFEAERLDRALLVYVRGAVTINYVISLGGAGVGIASQLLSRSAEIISNSQFGSYLGQSPSNIAVSHAPNGIKVSVTYNFTSNSNVFVRIPPGQTSVVAPLVIGRPNVQSALDIDLLPNLQNRIFGSITLPQIQTYGDYGFNPANQFNSIFGNYNPYYNQSYTSNTSTYNINSVNAELGNPSSILVDNVRESGLLNNTPITIEITGSLDTGSTAQGNRFFFERNPLVPYQLTSSINLTRFHGQFRQTGSSFIRPLYAPKINFNVEKGDIFRFTNIHDGNGDEIPVSFEREVTNVILKDEFLGDIKPSGSTLFQGGSALSGEYTYADTRLVIEFDSETPIPPQACYDYNATSRANPQYINQFIIYKKVPDETSVVLDKIKTLPPIATGSLSSSLEDSSSSGFLLPKYISKPLKEQAGNIIKNLKSQNLI